MLMLDFEEQETSSKAIKKNFFIMKFSKAKEKYLKRDESFQEQEIIFNNRKYFT